MIVLGDHVAALAIEPPIEMMTHVPRHYALALWKNVMVIYFARQATLETIKDLSTQWAVVAARYEHFSYIAVIDNGAALPDGDARLALRDMHDRYAPNTISIGVVLMGAGFWASALQGMVTNIRNLAKRKRTSELRTARATPELREWFTANHSARSGVIITLDEYDAIVAATLAQARATHAA